MSWGPARPADDGLAAHWHGRSLASADGSAAAISHLAQRWAGRDNFVLLLSDFGLGHGLLRLWQTWQQDPQHCHRLHVIAIAPRPPSRAQLAHAHAHAASACHALRDELLKLWPPLTPDIHLLPLAGGAFRLLLAVGPPDRVLRDLVAQVDGFVLDLASTEAATEAAKHAGATGWDRHRLRRLARLAAPGASLVVTAETGLIGPAAHALGAAGFVPEPAATPAPPSVTRARFWPTAPQQIPPGRQPLKPWGSKAGTVAVVGAGLAGAAVARALAALGWTVQVFDRQPGCAMETSGNAGGLFHGIVHGHDSVHARWLRAAALHTQRVLQPLLDSGQVAGSAKGLRRGERGLDAGAMRALLKAQGLPADYAQVLDPALPDNMPAWLLTGGGWLAPAQLCAQWLAGPGITLRPSCRVGRLQALSSGWLLMGDQGRALTQADAVVLCNAADARRLLAELPSQAGATAADWPLQRMRGQTTELPADLPGLPRLAMPLADAGYAMSLADGRLLCGGSSQADDENPLPRDQDHRRHLAILRRLTGWQGEVDPAQLGGRVGWRLHTDDRLPLLGPMPLAPEHGQRADQARLLPRVRGLYLFTALGSRGITQAALGGELLAAWISGTPLPLPAPLLDALDPARYICRAARRASAGAD